MYNIYTHAVKLLLVVNFCLLSLCCGQKETKQSLSNGNQILIAEDAVDINRATAAELEKLPHIGDRTAKAIIAHRERFGNFRKPEHLMLVPGISAGKFREIRGLITAVGD